MRLRKSWGWGEILVESEAQLDRLAERRRTVQDQRRFERVVVTRKGKQILLEVVEGEPPSLLRPTVAKRAKSANRASDPVADAASRFLGLAKAVLDARPWEHLLNRDVFGVEDPASRTRRRAR